MMDRQAFFAALRRRDSGVFGTSLTQGQVTGCEAILDQSAAQGADLPQTAYILATAYGETGGRMQAVRENMNYSAKRMREVWPSRFPTYASAQAFVGKPRELANHVYNGRLGNRPGTNDGWNFRGGSIGQITGRDNYAKWARNMAMTAEEFAAHAETTKGAAEALVLGMLGGWATDLKLAQFVGGARKDYTGARKTWNGTFEAAKYSKYARAFEAALKEAGYAPAARQKPIRTPKPTRPATPTTQNPLMALLRAVLRLLGIRQ